MLKINSTAVFLTLATLPSLSACRDPEGADNPVIPVTEEKVPSNSPNHTTPHPPRQEFCGTTLVNELEYPLDAVLPKLPEEEQGNITVPK